MSLRQNLAHLARLRDAETEIFRWEAVAIAYTMFLSRHLGFKQSDKEAVYEFLLLVSTGDEEHARRDMLSDAARAELSELLNFTQDLMAFTQNRSLHNSAAA